MQKYKLVVVKKTFDEIFDEVCFFFLTISKFTFVPLSCHFKKPKKKRRKCALGEKYSMDTMIHLIIYGNEKNSTSIDAIFSRPVGHGPS